MLRTYKGFEEKEKEHCFYFKALVRFPQNIKIVLTIYMVFDVNKKQFKFLEDVRHARESLYLENKNMLRTFLGLKLKKLRTIINL